MLGASAIVVIGLLLLVAGGEVLLRGAVGLAVHLRLTPAVIGLTVVAAGTSVPELAVSAVAAWNGSNDIAVGNVVGSNIFNLAVILGLASLIRPLAISGNTIRLEFPVLALVTLMAVAVTEKGSVERIDGVLFVAVYIGFTAYAVSLVRQQMSDKEVGEFRAEVNELSQLNDRAPGLGLCWIALAAGTALLGAGAQATVQGATQLAALFGLSERVIGLTIVSIGTGLPEVVTSVVSSARGRGDVAVGNVIGSNLFNILGILGINSIIRPMSVAAPIVAIDNWIMLGATLATFPLLLTGRRLSRMEGSALLLAYGAYLFWLLMRP